MSGWNESRVGCSCLDKECVCGVEGGGKESAGSMVMV